jgi:hypothetical protein
MFTWHYCIDCFNILTAQAWLTGHSCYTFQCLMPTGAFPDCCGNFNWWRRYVLLCFCRRAPSALCLSHHHSLVVISCINFVPRASFVICILNWILQSTVIFVTYLSSLGQVKELSVSSHLLLQCFPPFPSTSQCFTYWMTVSMCLLSLHILRITPSPAPCCMVIVRGLALLF